MTRAAKVVHRTWVKFNGRGHRAHCGGCLWIGQAHNIDREMARGRDMSSGWLRTKQLAEQDGRDHERRARADQARNDHGSPQGG